MEKKNKKFLIMFFFSPDLSTAMPRTHKRKLGARRYRDYSPSELERACNKVLEKGRGITEVAKEFNIPIRTIRNKITKKHTKPFGRPTVFSQHEEREIVANLLKCADFGMPLNNTDIRLFVKGYLTTIERTVKRFKNNVPGEDWSNSFIKRHTVLSNRMCQNVKRARAKVDPSEIKKYFENLEKVVEGVPPANILNYDETNLADNPGTKKCIFRRGVKYPERIINHSKGNISLMFCGSATGELLPPYVIYKAKNLYNTWVEGGPQGTRFGVSKNGWMNTENYDEWFSSIVVPWARRREGRKVIIGDNLSSHISHFVLQECKKHNIDFILLLPNSTDKCQPLDVGFFGPQKRSWRKILESYKMSNPSSASLDKSQFPTLLKKLIENMGLRNKENLVAGFRACGIVPFNPQKVLMKFPKDSGDSDSEAEENRKGRYQISAALLDYLQTFRYDPDRKNKEAPKPKKRLCIQAGKSLSQDDVLGPSTSTSAQEKLNVDDSNSVVESSESGSSDDESLELEEKILMDNLAEGDFVIINCATKKSKKYFVGKIEALHNDDSTVDIIFLKRVPSKSSSIFTFPENLDTGNVSIEDVEKKLPIPRNGDTVRTASFFYFENENFINFPCHIN